MKVYNNVPTLMNAVKQYLTHDLLQSLCEDSVSLVGKEQQRGSDMPHRENDDIGRLNSPGRC